MPLSAPNEELQQFVKITVLAGALEKDGGHRVVCHCCLWLLLGASVGILHLVLQTHGVGTQKVSKAKGNSIWLKYLEGVGLFGLFFFFKSKLQVEDPALKNKSWRTD